jgi:hypothetical protein
MFDMAKWPRVRGRIYRALWFVPRIIQFAWRNSTVQMAGKLSSLGERYSSAVCLYTFRSGSQRFRVPSLLLLAVRCEEDKDEGFDDA